MKLSFDFDSTLSINSVEEFAAKLIKEGHELWIVTARHEFQDKSGNKVNNNDLFEVTDELGIPREHIYFCGMKDKFHFFLNNPGFLWHLDDDIIELSFLRSYTNVFPIWRANGNDWYNQCNDLIRILKNNNYAV